MKLEPKPSSVRGGQVPGQRHALAGEEVCLLSRANRLGGLSEVCQKGTGRREGGLAYTRMIR